MNDSDAIAALTRELHRINRNLEMIFGIPEEDTESELGKQVQELVDEHKEDLRGIVVWPATDTSGQTHLCVRRGFMRPTSCFPVDDIEAARAYLSGIVSSASAIR